MNPQNELLTSAVSIRKIGQVLLLSVYLCTSLEPCEIRIMALHLSIPPLIELLYN